MIPITRKFALYVAAFSLCTGLVATGADKPKLPDGPGKATTERVCGSCHAAELVMNRRESVEGWSGVVEDMIRRGAKGTDEEFGEVVDYLTTHFPQPPPRRSMSTRRPPRTWWPG